MARKSVVKSRQIGASIKPKQAEAIRLLVAGMTYSATAKRLSIDRMTLYNWRHDPAFAAELQRLQTDALTGAIGVLKSKAQVAARSLARAAQHGDTVGAVPGARAVLDFAFKGVEFEILDERIRKLEEAQAAQAQKP